MNNGGIRRHRWLVPTIVGTGVGIVAAVQAARAPDYALADSAVKVVAELGVGYALIAAGAVSIARRRTSGSGWLLAAAGIGWFLPEWNTPAVSSPVLFTIGICLSAATPAVIAQALFATARPPRAAARLVLFAAYAGPVLLLGVVSALVFDPRAEGCNQCAANLLLVHGAPGLHRGLSRAGIYLGLASMIGAVALIITTLVRAAPTVRRTAGTELVAGCAYLAAIAAEFAADAGDGYLGTGPADHALWLAQAGSLGLLAVASSWWWLRRPIVRSRLARLVVDLGASPEAGGVEHALATTLGDRTLRIAYPLADGRTVDGAGHPVPVAPDATRMLRHGHEVAVLHHRPGLLDDPALSAELTATVRLALDHERLQAELLCHLADLRASRQRIVIAADEERRRLERDLHDGAQQLLVAHSIDLRLALLRLEHAGAGDPQLTSILRGAEAELTGAIDELRRLANGIFPAALAEEGLAAAVEALAEETQCELSIEHLPEKRVRFEVEAVAYHLIAEIAADATSARVSAAVRDHVLVIELASDRPPRLLSELQDRVGAVDGTLTVLRGSGSGTTLHAELPCGS